MEFTDFEATGAALSFTSPADIDILKSGYHYISWDVFKTGYDSAFALFGRAGHAAGQQLRRDGA